MNSNSKRIGLLKVAPGVQGKIIERENGTRIIVLEQRGRDLFLGKEKTLHEAIEVGVAGVCADRLLLTRAQTYNVSIVLIVVEELRMVYTARLDDFLDTEKSKSRVNWRQRGVRVLDYSLAKRKYLGPRLRRRVKRANA